MADDIVRRLRRPPAVARRLKVNWPAELRFAGRRRPCTVIDISRAGAHVAADFLPEGVREVRLVLDQGPPIVASLAWRARGRVGLRFLAEQDWLGELGPRRADAASWLGRP